MAHLYKITKIAAIPFEGQKPGTSGLRKEVPVFQKVGYSENFVQCTIDGGLGDKKKGSTLVVGGDGRYFNDHVVQLIIKIAAANGVSKLIVGHNGFMSTPAVSCVIRKFNTDGGIILTASHNPGGPKGDFGMKFNSANGGPATETVTERIFALSKSISDYKICSGLMVDVSKIGTQSFQIEQHGQFTVEVVDSVKDYVDLMKEIFDFDALKSLFSGQATGQPFRILLDAMHGATGPYLKRIFVEEFGAKPEDILNMDTLPDFGGLHPDPNLTYAAPLVEKNETRPTRFGSRFRL